MDDSGSSCSRRSYHHSVGLLLLGGGRVSLVGRLLVGSRRRLLVLLLWRRLLILLLWRRLLVGSRRRRPWGVTTEVIYFSLSPLKMQQRANTNITNLAGGSRGCRREALRSW